MYNATSLFLSDGTLRNPGDLDKIGKCIANVEVNANASEHENKLARIEIGLAIRAVAGGNGVGLTETISQLGLCETEKRSKNTFLKYARIAGSATLLQLANNPAISFSVLDELAASKKPIDPEQRKEFMSRLSDEVEGRCAILREEEGLPDDDAAVYRQSGPTRSECIGMIRRAQIEFQVPTRAVTPGGGEKERAAVKNRKNLARVARLVRLVSCYRIMFLTPEERIAWLEREDMDFVDLATATRDLTTDLVNDGLLKDLPSDLIVGNLITPGILHRLERDAENETKETTEQ